jgi:hypothetical protein
MRRHDLIHSVQWIGRLLWKFDSLHLQRNIRARHQPIKRRNARSKREVYTVYTVSTRSSLLLMWLSASLSVWFWRTVFTALRVDKVSLLCTLKCLRFCISPLSLGQYCFIVRKPKVKRPLGQLLSSESQRSGPSRLSQVSVAEASNLRCHQGWSTSVNLMLIRSETPVVE